MTNDRTHAREFLELHAWDVRAAAEAFRASPLAKTHVLPPPARRTGLAGFGRVEQPKDEDTNRYYAGGHSSGVAVQGKPEEHKPHAVERITTGAKAAGAVVDSRAAVPTHVAFTGGAQSVGGAQAAGPPPPVRPVVRVLAMYDDGFTVDDGPFRAFADPANQAFVADVEAGHVPRELEADARAQGAELQGESGWLGASRTRWPDAPVQWIWWTSGAPSTCLPRTRRLRAPLLPARATRWQRPRRRRQWPWRRRQWQWTRPSPRRACNFAAATARAWWAPSMPRTRWARRWHGWPRRLAPSR